MYLAYYDFRMIYIQMPSRTVSLRARTKILQTLLIVRHLIQVSSPLLFYRMEYHMANLSMQLGLLIKICIKMNYVMQLGQHPLRQRMKTITISMIGEAMVKTHS